MKILLTILHFLILLKPIPGKKTFEITKALKPIEVEGLGPSDIGLPIYIERSLPMVVALKVRKFNDHSIVIFSII